MSKFIYSKDDLNGILTSFITTGERWDGYARTVEVSDFWTKIISGKGHQDIILSLKPNEKHEQKVERVRLYNSRTKFVLNKIITQIQEVYRSDNIFNEIYFTEKNDDNADRVEKINNYLNNFSGSKTVREYLRDRYLRLNIFDPNAFMGVNFKIDEDNKLVFYPIEVRSKDVLGREEINGDLQYLAYVEKSNVKIVKEGRVKVVPAWKFWIFGHDWAILYHKVPIGAEGIGSPINIKEGKPEDFSHADYKYIFYYSEYNIKAGHVPVYCVGYVPDPENDDKTFESIAYPSKELFIELIWKKMTYDIHVTLHGIAQKFAFVPTCDYDDKELKLECTDGMLTNGDVCPQCHGSGQMPFHTSEQDIIAISLPKDKSTIWDLSKLIYYAPIPIEIIKLNREEIRETEKAISLAIFNTSIIDRGELLATKTATEIRSDLSATNNVLYLFGINDAQAYKFHVKQIAIYSDQYRPDFVIEYSYPNDFGLETLVELFAQATDAKESGSPQLVKSKITGKIISKLCIDNKQAIHNFENREYWRPFTELSQALLVPELDPSRILFVYFDQIFRELEAFEYGSEGNLIPFYLLPRDKQKEEIKKQIEVYKSQYAASRTVADPLRIPRITNGQTNGITTPIPVTV